MLHNKKFLIRSINLLLQIFEEELLHAPDQLAEAAAYDLLRCQLARLRASLDPSHRLDAWTSVIATARKLHPNVAARPQRWQGDDMAR